MRVTNIQTMSFRGRVIHDKARTQNQIENFPIPTQESIMGNMDTLAQRLRELTPDSENYKITFNRQDERRTLYDPKYYYGNVDVVNKFGQKASSKFFIGHMGGSSKDDRTVLSDGEMIWLEGFKDLTQKVLDGNLDKQDIVLFRKLSYLTLKEKEEFLNVYSRIENGEKTIMNKTDIAGKIITATKDSPDEIRDAIIGNINTLVQRLDREAPDNFRYLLRAKCVTIAPQRRLIGGFFDGHKDIYFQTGQISTKQYCITPNYFENLNFFNDELQSYKITTSVIPISDQPYCPTDSEQIYRSCFKPLTERALWEAWH